MELLSHKPDFSGIFDDKRLDRRAELLSHSLLMGRNSSIHAVTHSEAEQRGFYRFLSNEAATEDHLIAELTGRAGRNVSGRHVLVIQDSSNIGLSHQASHIKPDSGLGLVGNKTGLGFLSHTSLVLDADRETMLGYSDVQLWHRTTDKSNNTTKIYKKQPIEEKESNKWLKASKQAKLCLAKARKITIIQDREGDIYDQICIIPDGRTHFIIRSRDNRKLADGGRLYEHLAAASVAGTYAVKVFGDIRKGKVKRVAQVAVKYSEVTIARPAKSNSKELPPSITLYAVEVKEINPRTKDAICWRLLTSEQVLTFEDALIIIGRYKLRWYIEQLFRLLKRQGFRIESSELESGWAIRKLFVLLLNAALRVMQLYLSCGNEESQATTEVFSEDEINCLEQIEKTQLPPTANTQNPFPKERLAWACWIIARLGGWKANNKQRQAGPILLHRGLQKFDLIFQGWEMAQMII
jgi:Transposase DNA-binding/Transposase DDE domain